MKYDPIASLESVGYLDREASFLYLVAVHSGYFLSRQFSRFVHGRSGALSTRFLERASRLHHIQVIECGRRHHIYHLTSKPVYQALRHRDSQNRRIKGDAHIKSRLMVLDFVLANLGCSLLEDEAAKVSFFTSQYGIAVEQLPRSYVGRLMYFSDGFPILFTQTGVPRFTFFDEGQITVARFERYLEQHRRLFETLGEFELIFVADAESNSARAQAAFNRFLPAEQLRGFTCMTPLGVDHFLDYLEISRRREARGIVNSARDLEILRQGETLYTTLEHHALQSAWRVQSTDAQKIRQRFSKSPLRATFTTVILPYSYPIFKARRNPPMREGDETRHQIHQHIREQKT